ncbi:MAG TPA: hypothetical protein VMY37_05205 [Thermoguttaceae bacterium]|nr:hypothetical protein [Thermoguttaceae bacterium]
MTWRDPLQESRGIVYVAFGEEYIKVGAASAHSVRQWAYIPIHVVTNREPGEHRDRWPEGTTFDYMPVSDEQNRSIRTHIDTLTPFDRTLLLDADVYCASNKALVPFDYLERFDMVVVTYKTLGADPGLRIHKDWGPLCQHLGTGGHFCYCGGILYFRKGARVTDFFSTWHRFWEQSGQGRDMLPMFTALWRSQVRFLPMPGPDVWIGQKHGVFRHSAGTQIPQLPPMRHKFKPNGSAGEWVKVTMKGPPR